MYGTCSINCVSLSYYSVMKFRWLLWAIWIVSLPTVQCLKDCPKPSGVCYPHDTKKKCLQDPLSYNGEAMVAQGSMSDLDDGVQKARKKYLDTLIQNYETVIKHPMSGTTDPCEKWNSTKTENNQTLGVLTDTVCRHFFGNSLPEGPSIDSLKSSTKLYCLPWTNTKDFQLPFADDGDSYCRNPTNSSTGPYCYISERHTRPCFVSCEPQLAISGKFKFKIRVQTTDENETNCNSVCSSHQMNCSFENYDRLLEGKLMENLAKELPSPKNNCGTQKGNSIFGSELAVSRWNFPVYKISTGCVYGYMYRTDVPKCEETIENSTDFARLCACTNDKISAQTSGFTKRLPSTIENIAKSKSPGKSKYENINKNKNFKIAIYIAAVLFFIAIALITVAIIFMVHRKSKSRKKLGAIASAKTHSSKQRSKHSNSSRKSHLKSNAKKQISMKSHEISKPAEISAKSKQPTSFKTKTISKLDDKSTGKSNVYFTKDELNFSAKGKYKGVQPNASLAMKSVESKEISLKKPATYVPTDNAYEFVLPRETWDKVKAKQNISKKEVSEMKDSKKA